MPYYTLFNKQLSKKLVHPTIGLWYTNNLIEAKDMLESCKEYLRFAGLESLQDNFVIIDAETEEEVPA